MKVYCKDCHWFSKACHEPMFPIWTWYDSCSHKNNMKKQDIGECPVKLKGSVVANIFDSSNMITAASHFDKLVKYNKMPEEINKNHNCKDFAITLPKRLQWFKRKNLVEKYGEDFIKYKYDFRDWGLGQPSNTK